MLSRKELTMLIDPLFIYTSDNTAPPSLPQTTGGMMMVQAGYIRTSRYRHGIRSMMWRLNEITKKSTQIRWLENIILKGYLKSVLVVVNLLQGILILNTVPKAVETRTVLVQNENNLIEFQI